jgi:hypothetical protein
MSFIFNCQSHRLRVRTKSEVLFARALNTAKKRARGAVVLCVCFLVIQDARQQLGAASVVTYPAPPSERKPTDYQVWVNDRPLDLYTARVLDAPFAGKEWDYGGPYWFGSFDMQGRVTIRVKSNRSLRPVMVRPESAGIRPRYESEHMIELVLDHPCKLSLEPDGRKGPLLLFANAIERNAPKPGAPGVIYFKPGVHQAGKIDATNNQTVYLAGGAVVKGAIVARGTNIQIRGRGMLDGSDYEWRKGPYGVTVGIQGTNILVEDIIIRGSSHWTVVPRGSRYVTIRNLKLCNSRVQNDDGINPCNSQDILIQDCFIRSDDDCVALKGLELNMPNPNVERIKVENCIFWCDRARIFLLGHESRAPFMRDITLRNIDIIHFTMTPFLFEPGEDMRLENVIVDNVRVWGEGQNELARLKPVVNQYMRKKVPGFVSQVQFRNLELTGLPGRYAVQLEGADAEHTVSQIVFDQVRLLGTDFTRQSPALSVGHHVKDVLFEPFP